MSKNRQSRRAEAAKQKRQALSASRPAAHQPSLSPGLRAARSLDGYAHLRDRLFELAGDRADWAGIPMPLDGHRLIVEPSFPKAKELMSIGAEPVDEGEADDGGWYQRNRWYSRKHRCDIIIMQRGDEISWGKIPAFHHITQDITTIGASVAWGLEQEQRALQLLGTMVRHHQMKQYILTGMFLETSRRSGITYVFRRLKPTVALAAHPGLAPEKKGMRILASLCMHPIAHYADSWAGAMCPTDDVIAHLALMRGDEHMYWKRANQHPPWRPEAGL